MLRLHSLERGETSPDGFSIDAILTRELRLVRSRANASPDLLDVCSRELWLRSHASQSTEVGHIVGHNEFCPTRAQNQALKPRSSQKPLDLREIHGSLGKDF